MKTFKELKNFCEKNNVRYEINPLYSRPKMIEQFVQGEDGKYSITMVEHRTILGYEIGMNNIAGKKGQSEWQWVWFETVLCPETLEDDTKFIFRNRYSQVNGENHKGFRESWQAEKTIERRMA